MYSVLFGLVLRFLNCVFFVCNVLYLYLMTHEYIWFIWSFLTAMDLEFRYTVGLSDRKHKLLYLVDEKHLFFRKGPSYLFQHSLLQPKNGKCRSIMGDLPRKNGKPYPNQIRDHKKFIECSIPTLFHATCFHMNTIQVWCQCVSFFRSLI